ncbi:Polyketide synthase enoylreductase [Pyrenophora tritici-repentis]|nr:Polyketide synthase enoylreductase [Pyrenophora tritici-repentis]
MAPTNRAAWLTGKQVHPLVVSEAPYTPPGDNEVVKTGAVAINPIDSMKQLMGDNMMGWVKYPFTLGEDVAGEVVEVGSNVKRFSPGDRVIGHAVGLDSRSNKSSEGAFQKYVVLRSNLVSPIPDNLPYEKACVLPLCLSTAACQYLLIWGGSTSLGSNAIQLAVASGYDVITTCSPRNFDYVKSLGASQVFDYNDASTIPSIISLLKDKQHAGALAIGPNSMGSCIPIIASTPGRKFIAQASLPMPNVVPPKGMQLVSFIAGFVWFKLSTFVKCKVKGVGYKFIWGNDLMVNEVGKAVYEDFLPVALSVGKFQAKPEAEVVGRGLESVQEGLDRMMKGVSAKKLVVVL